MSGGMVASTKLVNDVLVAITALPDTLAYRSNSGLVVTLTGQPMRVNVPGIGDVSGVRRGRAFSIECKFGSGRLSSVQRNFRRRWEAAGGLYVIARCVDDALRALTANSLAAPLA